MFVSGQGGLLMPDEIQEKIAAREAKRAADEAAKAADEEKRAQAKILREQKKREAQTKREQRQQVAEAKAEAKRHQQHLPLTPLVYDQSDMFENENMLLI